MTDTGRSPSGRAGGPADLSRDASQPKALIPNAELADRIRCFLPKVADFLEVVKSDWERSGDWTEWAQSIRSETTALMLALEPEL